MSHLPDRCENDRKKALRLARERRYAKRRAQVNALRRLDPEVRKTEAERRRALRLMRDFGITVEQYDKMLELQGGVCVFCKRPPKKLRLAVEHCHDTGRVRGLACYQCNHFLISKNTVESARFLVSYLGSDFDGRLL